MIAIARIQITIPSDEEQQYKTIAKGLNTSLSELIREAMFEFMTNNKHKIPKRMQNKYLEKKIRQQQKELHFINNWKRRLGQQINPRISTGTFINFKMIQLMLNQMEQQYACLDETTQHIIQKEYSELLELKTERKFNNFLLQKMDCQLVSLNEKPKRINKDEFSKTTKRETRTGLIK